MKNVLACWPRRQRNPALQGRLACFCVALTSCFCAPRADVPCVSVGDCQDGRECLANRCTPVGLLPVAPNSLRLVVEPSEIGAISERGGAGEELTSAVVLGSAALGRSVLYLRFAPVWRNSSGIQSAFVLLEPMPATAPDSEDVAVEAWRIGAKWSAKKLTWLDRPRLMPPSTHAVARFSPPLPLRIDVTEIIRYLAENSYSDHGVAITAAGGKGHGASFATGTSVGAGPRLELYVR